MSTINGINQEQLNNAFEAVRQNPALAKASLQAKTTWSAGLQSQVEMGSAAQAYGKASQSRSYQVFADQAEALLGQYSAPAAMETLVAAAGASIAGGWAAFGAAKGINVEKLEIELQAEVDLQGSMGLSQGVRPGLQQITGNIYVKSSASDAQLQELKETAEKLSPVVDSLRVPVKTKLIRM